MRRILSTVSHARQSAFLLVSFAALIATYEATRPGTTGSSARGASHAAAAARHSPDPVAPAANASATGSKITGAVAVARHIYANEVSGGRAHFDLQLVASNRALLGDLARGDLAAAQSNAYRQMTGNAYYHITRVSVLRGGRALVNAVWNSNGSFVVAPLSRPLYLGGRTLGTLLVSIQDVVGYVKLIHAFTGAYAVVRGSSGQVRTSLGAAAYVHLPSSGRVTIAGRRYAVGSFALVGWGGEALTVWVLAAA